MLPKFDYLMSIYFPGLRSQYKVDFLYGLFEEENEIRSTPKNRTGDDTSNNKTRIDDMIDDFSQNISISYRENPSIHPEFGGVFNKTNENDDNNDISSEYKVDLLEMRFIGYLQLLHFHLNVTEETILRLSSFTVEHETLINDIIKENIYVPLDLIENLDKISDDDLRFILEELLKRNRIYFKKYLNTTSDEKECPEEKAKKDENEITRIEVDIIKEKYSVGDPLIDDEEDPHVDPPLVIESETIHPDYVVDDDFNSLGKNCSSISSSLANPTNIGINPFKHITIDYEQFNKEKNKTIEDPFEYPKIENEDHSHNGDGEFISPKEKDNDTTSDNFTRQDYKTILNKSE